MVLRRSLNGSLARDSFYTDIMPVDPVFTPPLVPPPPYSPPEYAEISNDPVIMESPEFMDDLSTPTPVIGPNELPPPYSILDFAGRTISVGCAVAQEYQVNSSEVRIIVNICFASKYFSDWICFSFQQHPAMKEL